jgi:predicted DNA-binding WGR domain protein
MTAPVQTRLEKFDHVDGRHRYCVLRLSQTLFGEWCLEQAKGPIGAPGGQQIRAYFHQHGEALQNFESLRASQVKRGFVPIPVQLGLL